MSQSVCLPFRILPGQTAAAHAFMKELEDARFEEYERSQARISVISEHWFIGSVGSDDHFIGFITYEDFARAVEIFSASRDPFDVWFKEQLQTCTGIDFNNPPELDLPVLVSAFPRTDS